MARKALSLVELIISIGIVAVIFSTTIVSLQLADRRKLEVSARKMLADLMYAREIAVTRHQNYSVPIDTGNNTYTFEYQTRVADADIVSAPGNVTFNYPKGTITAASDTIRLERGGRAREIKLYDQTGFLDVIVP